MTILGCSMTGWGAGMFMAAAYSAFLAIVSLILVFMTLKVTNWLAIVSLLDLKPTSNFAFELI